MGACFAATACCFFWFAAFALSCFCAACLCTAFGDLSPIISLPFGCWFTDPQHAHVSESDWNRELHCGCCQTANVSSCFPTVVGPVSDTWWAATTNFGRRHGHYQNLPKQLIKTPKRICQVRPS